MADNETKGKPGRPRGVGIPPAPKQVTCHKCGGNLVVGTNCPYCGASAEQAWTPPEGYQPPISDEEVKQRSPRHKGRLSEEQVWELRRRWRNSDLPLYSFAGQVAADKSLPVGKDGIIAALRGWKAYKGV